MDQQIDEKISWQNLIIALGITAFSVVNYREYNTLKKIYKAVNSEQSIPSKSDSLIIEKIRLEVIEKIRTSNIFNKFNKSFILDSISKVDFRVVESIDFTRESNGCYINLKRMKDLRKNVLLDVPSKDNFIVIERRVLSKKNAYSTISHEIYHYFDKLLGKDDYKYSHDIKLDTFIDKNLENKKYCLKKISGLIGAPVEEKDKKAHNLLLDELYKALKSEKNYYNNTSEIFVRYKTLKDDMIRLGIINNVNSKITATEILILLDKYTFLDRLDILPYLFYLDLSRLEELDKVI